MKATKIQILFLCLLCTVVSIGCRKQFVTKYPNGSIYQINTFRYPFKKHILDGKSQMYYTNGQLQIEAFYKEGKIEGIVRSFYPSGAKFDIKLMKNSKQNGYDSIWFENGNLNIVAHYKDGKLHGKYQKWRGNGNYIELTSFKHGLEDGIRKTWSEDGGQMECEMRDGILNGYMKIWYPNGQLQSSSHFVYGKICGIVYNLRVPSSP